MRATWAALGGLLLGACGMPAKPVRKPYLDVPAPLAGWPWKDAKPAALGTGIHRWQTRDGDGTEADLIEFDFAANPRLRFELYDQDEDDASPFDDRADYFPNGVGQVTRHLNETRKGRVVAAWNGLFFAYDRRTNPPNGIATHIGPNVLAGEVRYNVGNHRWTFGVKQGTAGPTFKAILLPDKATLASEFDYAAVGAQLLVREGRPLRLAPFPDPDTPPPPREPMGPNDAGSIPLVDFMKTSRTSMGWSRDGKRFWLLIVNEPDHELGSKLAVKRGEEDTGGWSLADLQRFWLAFGAWGAVNSDGGAVAQFTLRRPDGKYEMLPPRLVAPNRWLVFEPDFEGAPQGGTLMTFYVREE